MNKCMPPWHILAWCVVLIFITGTGMKSASAQLACKFQVYLGSIDTKPIHDRISLSLPIISFSQNLQYKAPSEMGADDASDGIHGIEIKDGAKVLSMYPSEINEYGISRDFRVKFSGYKDGLLRCEFGARRPYPVILRKYTTYNTIRVIGKAQVLRGQLQITAAGKLLHQTDSTTDGSLALTAPAVLRWMANTDRSAIEFVFTPIPAGSWKPVRFRFGDLEDPSSEGNFILDLDNRANPVATVDSVPQPRNQPSRKPGTRGRIPLMIVARVGSSHSGAISKELSSKYNEKYAGLGFEFLMFADPIAKSVANAGNTKPLFQALSSHLQSPILGLLVTSGSNGKTYNLEVVWPSHSCLTGQGSYRPTTPLSMSSAEELDAAVEDLVDRIQLQYLMHMKQVPRMLSLFEKIAAKEKARNDDHYYVTMLAIQMLDNGKMAPPETLNKIAHMIINKPKLEMVDFLSITLLIEQSYLDNSALHEANYVAIFDKIRTTRDALDIKVKQEFAIRRLDSADISNYWMANLLLSNYYTGKIGGKFTQRENVKHREILNIYQTQLQVQRKIARLIDRQDIVEILDDYAVAVKISLIITGLSLKDFRAVEQILPDLDWRQIIKSADAWSSFAAAVLQHRTALMSYSRASRDFFTQCLEHVASTEAELGSLVEKLLESSSARSSAWINHLKNVYDDIEIAAKGYMLRKSMGGFVDYTRYFDADDLYDQSGKRAQAIAAYEKLLAENGEFELHAAHRLTHLYSYDSNYDKAYHMVQQLISKFPDSSHLTQLAAKFSCRLGKREECAMYRKRLIIFATSDEEERERVDSFLESALVLRRFEDIDEIWLRCTKKNSSCAIDASYYKAAADYYRGSLVNLRTSCEQYLDLSRTKGSTAPQKNSMIARREMCSYLVGRCAEAQTAPSDSTSVWQKRVLQSITTFCQKGCAARYEVTKILTSTRFGLDSTTAALLEEELNKCPKPRAAPIETVKDAGTADLGFDAGVQ